MEQHTEANVTVAKSAWIWLLSITGWSLSDVHAILSVAVLASTLVYTILTTVFLIRDKIKAAKAEGLYDKWVAKADKADSDSRAKSDQQEIWTDTQP